MEATCTRCGKKDDLRPIGSLPGVYYCKACIRLMESGVIRKDELRLDEGMPP